MAEIKDYIWFFPIVAGIIAFLSLLAPAVSMNFQSERLVLIANFWFWDLYIYNLTYVFGYIRPYITMGADFIMEPIVLTTNFITTGVLTIGGILLLIIGITSRKRMKLNEIKTQLFLIGYFFIITEILWLILVPLFFPMAYYWDYPLRAMPYTFWRWDLGFISYPLHTPGFGVIGGFIAAFISFGGAGTAHYYSKERVKKIPEKKEVKSSTTKHIF